MWPLWVSKDDCITKEKEKLIKGEGIFVCAPGYWRLEVSGKTVARRKFQFFGVMETNVLANEVVRHFSNFTAKGCWESAKSVYSQSMLWLEWLTNSFLELEIVVSIWNFTSICISDDNTIICYHQADLIHFPLIKINYFLIIH